MKFLQTYSKKGLFTILALIACFSISQAQVINNEEQNDRQQSDRDVIQIINESAEHSVFSQLIEEAELAGMLEQEGPFTLLAPTDEAFERSGINVERIREDRERLRDLVMAHILMGTFSLEEVEEARHLEVSEGDIEASNGVVHILDEVIENIFK